MSLFNIKKKGTGGLLKGIEQKITAKNEEQQNKISALQNIGIAPSEMTAEELKAHQKEVAGIPKMQANIAKTQTFVSKLNAPSKLSTVNDAIKQKQAATAGTTPRGMFGMMAPNLLGSGPSPMSVKNSLMSFKKKSKIF